MKPILFFLNHRRVSIAFVLTRKPLRKSNGNANSWASRFAGESARGISSGKGGGWISLFSVRVSPSPFFTGTEENVRDKLSSYIHSISVPLA